MAEMALGYGSEYQLLRFLGHHRNTLDELLLKNTTIDEDSSYDMEWLDFPKDSSRKSLDGEYVGIDFLPEKVQEKIQGNWTQYWPERRPNWDGVLYCSPFDPNADLKDKWIIVEAKAHLDEMISSCREEGEDRVMVEKAFDLTQRRFGIEAPNDWTKQYYQLANRLAFVNFMLDQGIQCSLLYIYFINGWQKSPYPEKSVPDIETWKKAIRDEYAYLGLNDNARKYISEIFVEC